MSENAQVEKNNTEVDQEKKAFTTGLSEWSNTITNLIERDYDSCGVKFDDYSKKCALEAMTSIYNLVRTNPKVNMGSLDTSNLRGIVERCASLKLNPSAYPRECYFQLRNVKVGIDEYGKDIWQQMVEFGIEGAGYDALLSNYGKDVDRVYPYWVVKEGDTYIPPKHKGIEITPPEWEEKGLSEKAARVVYPVKLTDGTVVYLMANRESVKVNFLAHVKQNMINATFGICADRYKATEKQKEQIKEKKAEVLNALRKCETIDDMISCEAAKPFISSSWLDTPESMIVRKMLNNATRKYPKNYDTMANKAFIEMDEIYQNSRAEIAENENSQPFEVVADVEAKEEPSFVTEG